MAKLGYVEMLYIGERIGLIFLWMGFVVNDNVPKPNFPPKDTFLQ